MPVRVTPSGSSTKAGPKHGCVWTLEATDVVRCDGANGLGPAQKPHHDTEPGLVDESRSQARYASKYKSAQRDATDLPVCGSEGHGKRHRPTVEPGLADESGFQSYASTLGATHAS